LYSDGSTVPVEAKVAYEDGRTSVIRAELKIRAAETFHHVARRQAAGG
jgi:hypothetical protein